MGHPIPKSPCHCANSGLPLTSTLLFLSWILPSSSFAQVTNSPPRTQTPSTLSTSRNPSPTAPLPPFGTQSNPPISTTNSSTSHNSASPAFNYYFLIVALVVLLLCACVLYIGRRKKRKAAMMRSNGRNALARDVEGWRTRLGYGRALGSSNTIHRVGREDGLDERGEAPPPYAPGPKPPSIRTNDGRRPSITPGNTGMEDVELGALRSDSNGPPKYHEHMEESNEEDIADIRRPARVVTASDRFGSMRRLMSNTAGTS